MQKLHRAFDLPPDLSDPLDRHRKLAGHGVVYESTSI
jgi:hypothetical protein